MIKCTRQTEDKIREWVKTILFWASITAALGLVIAAGVLMSYTVYGNWWGMYAVIFGIVAICLTIGVVWDWLEGGFYFCKENEDEIREGLGTDGTDPQERVS